MIPKVNERAQSKCIIERYSLEALDESGATIGADDIASVRVEGHNTLLIQWVELAFQIGMDDVKDGKIDLSRIRRDRHHDGAVGISVGEMRISHG